MATILILDDNAEILEMLEATLKMQGFTVSTSASKKDFMEQLGKTKPHVILLDILLGEDDGRHICKQLKEHEETRHIPILLTSASSNELKSHKEYYADGVLEKPFNMADLVAKINLYR